MSSLLLIWLCILLWQCRQNPECWSDGSEPGWANCAGVPLNATINWLTIGGRRIDNANSYKNQKTIGLAIRYSGVPRSEIFITSKTGPGNALGFNETLNQTEQVLQVRHLVDRSPEI